MTRSSPKEGEGILDAGQDFGVGGAACTASSAVVLRAGVMPADPSVAVELAARPDVVRGYEDVKLANVRRYRDRQTALLAQLVDCHPDQEARSAR